MAMVNGLTVSKGARTQKNYFPNGTLSSGSVTLHDAQRLIRRGVQTAKQAPPYEKPLPHRYISELLVYWNGTTQSRYPSGQPQAVIDGLQSKTLSYVATNDFASSRLAQEKAINQLMEKIRGSVDLSIDLIQWRQVARMISFHNRGVQGLATLFNEIGKSIRSLDSQYAYRLKKAGSLKGRARERRLRDIERWHRRRLQNTANWAAEKRLEYVYGWKPAAETIVELGKRAVSPTRYHKWIEVEGFGREIVNSVQVIGAERREYRTNFKCHVSGFIDPDTKQLSHRLAEITSLNPAAILWEATPFSFVVDWFVDIGSWIRSLETLFLYRNTWRGGFITHGYRYDAKLTEFVNTPLYLRMINASVMKKCFARSPLQAMPMPPIPSFRTSVGSSRLLNAAALLQVNSKRIDAFISSFATPGARRRSGSFS